MYVNVALWVAVIEEARLTVAETKESTFLCLRCLARLLVEYRALDLGPCGQESTESGLCRKCLNAWQDEKSKVPVVISRSLGEEDDGLSEA